MSTANGSAVPVTSITSGTKGAVPDDGFFPSSQWTGRKDRRHKGNNKFLDGKYQVSSSENQNIQCTITHGNMEEQVGYVDGGPMDSGKAYFDATLNIWFDELELFNLQDIMYRHMCSCTQTLILLSL